MPTKLPPDNGWMGDPKRGASMGRESKFPDVPDIARWTLQRVRLDAGGYDSGGAYWGTGRPLYWASADDAELFFRANDRNHAKATVRVPYPSARFYR